MAKYANVLMTNDGYNLFAQSQGAGQLIFTGMKIGDGTLNTSEDIKTLTALKNPLLTANINGIDTSVSGQVTLTAIINNRAVETGFFARELGIYAKIGEDGTEKLYAYTNAGNYADYMPDKNTPVDENKIEITLIIGNASNVIAVINDSIIYSTKEDTDKNIVVAVAAHNNDGSAHKDIRQLINDTIKNIDLSPYAKLLSPEFSGIPTAPTADMGVNTNQIATMAAIVSALKDYTKTTELPNVSGLGIVTQSLAASGYIKFANGFIMQWFQYGNTGNTTTPWPITFPAACVGAIADGNSRETRCYAFNQSNVSYAGDGTYGRVLGWGF
ncbi:phage tail protein [Pectinatus frisingensis]|uniref:gp53-like domain-containing protein n=1 Tax=Pectinatus frisingensis TaxID=865 RepID=UPI0018C5ACB1|nr:phage tail protein [Pectinatus frisingensis]